MPKWAQEHALIVHSKDRPPQQVKRISPFPNNNSESERLAIARVGIVVERTEWNAQTP